MTDKTPDTLSRRKMLARIGALATAAYTVPAFTTLSMAHASGASSSSGSSGSSGSGGPSDPSGPSDMSGPSDPSTASTPSGPSSSSSDDGCAAGTSWDGKTYNSGGKVCSPD